MATLRTMSGASAPLVGTTLSVNPHLAGQVLEDQLRSFSTDTSTGYLPVSGTLQDRVVRLRDGRLCFMYRIYNLAYGKHVRPDPIGINQFIGVRFSTTAPSLPAQIEVEYRTDGLGVIGPERVMVYGDTVQFLFTTARSVTPSALSRFMYILPIDPIVTDYTTGGRVSLSSVQWYVDIPNCFKPR
jgi:hypothetical protein